MNAGKAKGNIFNEARQLQTISDELSSRGWAPNWSKGGQLKGPCLIHGSSKRSRAFSVNTVYGKFYCHKCGEYGDVIDPVAALDNLDVFQAAKEIVNRGKTTKAN